MTHPTDADTPDPAGEQLRLDEGEILELRPDAADIVLRLPATRAYDLSRVLDAYTGLLDLASAAATVSSTEQSLARSLRDAAARAGYDGPAPWTSTRVDSAGRLRAMAQLQARRSDLSHSTVVAIVDAAAWLVDRDQDYDVTGLLDAVADQGESTTGADVYLALLDYPSAGPDDDNAGRGEPR